MHADIHESYVDAFAYRNTSQHVLGTSAAKKKRCCRVLGTTDEAQVRSKTEI